MCSSDLDRAGLVDHELAVARRRIEQLETALMRRTELLEQKQSELAAVRSSKAYRAAAFVNKVVDDLNEKLAGEPKRLGYVEEILLDPTAATPLREANAAARTPLNQQEQRERIQKRVDVCSLRQTVYETSTQHSTIFRYPFF